MAVHKWRQRQSRHFGTVWVPYAQIELQAVHGVFQPLALQIDSGAIVSILRRSVAALLGIKLEGGRRIELGSVGGGSTVAYAHEIQTKFADDIAYSVPFAFAETESVPNLLGRLGVFDLLQIDFDATLTQTEIRSPWLDPPGRRLWKFLIETEAHIMSRFPELEVSDFAKNAIRCFLNRGEQIIASAYAMMRHECCYAGPALVRSMFELSLQFEYLMQEPNARGEQYCEYAHISKHKMSQAIVANPSGIISAYLAASPLRVEGEKRNQAEYDRVRSRFMSRNKKGKEHIWENWYGMPVRNLAEKLNRDKEYVFIYALTSAWAHGDPFSTTYDDADAFCDPHVLFPIVKGYYARMLLTLVDSGKIVLSNEQYNFLTTLSQEMS